MPVRQKPTAQVRTCTGCGCTDEDCSGCIRRTGHACHWVAPALCSACRDYPPVSVGSTPLDVPITDSPAIRRMIEEVRVAPGTAANRYNRVYSRHNRS